MYMYMYMTCTCTCTCTFTTHVLPQYYALKQTVVVLHNTCTSPILCASTNSCYSSQHMYFPNTMHINKQLLFFTTHVLPQYYALQQTVVILHNTSTSPILCTSTNSCCSSQHMHFPNTMHFNKQLLFFTTHVLPQYYALQQTVVILHNTCTSPILCA